MGNSQSITRGNHRRRGQRIAAVCAVMAVGMLAAVVPAAATTGPAPGLARLSLPEPTGRYQVGAVALHLIDRSRLNPWQTDRTYRELMVSVYYPTPRAGGRPHRAAAGADLLPGPR